MRKNVERVGHILWLALRPIPGWRDKMQSILSFILMVAPTLTALIGKLKGGRTWTLRNGIFSSIGLFALAVLIAAYRLHEQLDELLDGMPNLVCKEMSHIMNPITNGVTGQIIGIPTFYHMKIANEPRGAADRKTAQAVAGRVRILHEDRTEAAKERLHRWEHSPGPFHAGKAADLLQGLNIAPNGIECSLDIAMKYDDEEDFYTVTNDTVRRGCPGWRDPQFKFPPGIYIASVRLLGENLVKVLECKIINRGKGEKLELIALDSTSS